MSVSIKSPHEIRLMRYSGKLLEEVFNKLSELIEPGISTWDINKKGEEYIRKSGSLPNFLNYNGFPASICTSINEAVVHGIPNKNTILKEGDIISLDCGLVHDGYHSDMARTFPVGEISSKAQKLIDVTRESFFEGIRFARAGNHLHQISAAIGYYARSNGYGVVEDLVGHGIGTSLHEDPPVPNFPCKSRGIRLRAGMTLAIEPMINAGTYEVICLDDGWTVVTADGEISAHYENTILITDDEPEILTLSK